MKINFINVVIISNFSLLSVTEIILIKIKKFNEENETSDGNLQKMEKRL